MANWKDVARIIVALDSLENLKGAKKIDGPTYKEVHDLLRHQLKEVLKDSEQYVAKL